MDLKRNLKLTLEYDGTRYLGWQVQPQGPTVQEKLEEAILRITGERVRVIGAGRTDAGVHAEGQVASVRLSSVMPVRKMCAALNAVLPPDIAVRSVEEVGEDFHARYSAKSKRYRYTIINRPVRTALCRGAALHIPRPLDVAAMKEAASHLRGTHDFSSFGCNAGRNDNPVRKVLEVSVERQGDRVVIEIEAVSFLYKMVRSIVGTLIDVGKGKLTPDEFLHILEARDRKCARPTAPPEGLCLAMVTY